LRGNLLFLFGRMFTKWPISLISRLNSCRTHTGYSAAKNSSSIGKTVAIGKENSSSLQVRHISLFALIGTNPLYYTSKQFQNAKYSLANLNTSPSKFTDHTILSISIT
jgi:hypothetical protein